jgi:hypothetical protein
MIIRHERDLPMATERAEWAWLMGDDDIDE